MKKILVASVALAAAMIPASASAQGIPVVDPSNIAQTIKVVQNGVQQVQQMKAQVEQISEMKNTIGAIGGDLLKRLNAMIDYSGNRLFVKKDK